MPLNHRPLLLLGVATGCLALAGLGIRAADAPAAPSTPAFTNWQLTQLLPIVNKSLSSGRNFERGKELFSKLACSTCHSFGGGETDGAGGIGPDLTGVGGRYGVRDILDSIISPSNVISNLYAAIIVHTTDGKQLSGKVIYQDDNEVALAENVFDLTKLTKIPRDKISDMEDSPVSIMPPGLINGSTSEEISDLVAFLISGGDSGNRMFRPTPAPAAK
jgi:putative heme-binding domain-containing protein